MRGMYLALRDDYGRFVADAHGGRTATLSTALLFAEETTADYLDPSGRLSLRRVAVNGPQLRLLEVVQRPAPVPVFAGKPRQKRGGRSARLAATGRS